MKKYINIKYCVLGWMFVLLGFVNVTFAQTADLTTHQPIASPPSGVTFEWHNALPISASNWVASPTAVLPRLYYGVYNFGTCYSEAAPIRVATNICPVTTVDLNSFVEPTSTPSGMTLTFHNASPVSDSNRLSGSAITAVAPSGTYYIAYRDNIVGCFSKESVIVVVSSSCLAAIVAVVDTPSALPGTNTPSVLLNDTINGVQAVIGTNPGEVTLTSTLVPGSPLTMNLTTGTVAVAANTPAGSYPITYTICEVSNPTNCSTVTSTILVNVVPDLTTVILLVLNNLDVGEPQDFTVRLNELLGAATSAPASFNIAVPFGYTLSFDVAQTTSNVLFDQVYNISNLIWNTSVNSSSDIDLQSKPGFVIGANLNTVLGFKITRTSTAVSNSVGNIIVSIYADLAKNYDSNTINNFYSRIVTAN